MPGPQRKSRRRAAERHSPPSGSILTLQRELHGRFVSRGGRPADPAPTIRRLVTLKKEVWKALKCQAVILSKVGHGVTPGQLAAMILERAISDGSTEVH